MDLLKKVTSLAKRRGFIFPGSEIYGGLANTYDYGPLGVELLRNLRNHWWHFFVTTRENIYGLETSVLMNPKVWEASGHTNNFTDTLVVTSGNGLTS
jgi:glycyl-tRNA synthetase